MKIPFACPSCGASGLVDGSFVGRQVRCRQCTHRFAVPGPGDPDAGGYDLAEPARVVAGVAASGMDAGPVYVPSRGGEPASRPASRKPKPGPVARRKGPGFAWKRWLVRLGGLAAIALLVTALFAPKGMMLAGSAMVLLGTAMVLVGYTAGAFGAFSEDFLYGFLYLVIPLYTAYYLVTRWDDLRMWFACSTAGVGLVVAGTQMLIRSGVVVA